MVSCHNAVVFTLIYYVITHNCPWLQYSVNCPNVIAPQSSKVDPVPLPFAPVRVGARAMAIFVSVFPLPLSFPFSILTVPTRAMGGRASSFPENQRERWERCRNRRFPCRCYEKLKTILTDIARHSWIWT